MPIRLLLAWLHLLALGVGLAAVWGRARALRDSLREPHEPGSIRRALTADTWWGVAAGVWLITGLWRLLASTEKTTSYYLGNHLFYAKMGLFAGVLAMEGWPMLTVIRWRRSTTLPTPRDVGRIEIISYVQCALVVAMVLTAVSMARGYGTMTRTPEGVIADSLRGLGEPLNGAETTTTAVTPTNGDLEVLGREIAMPLAGVDPVRLRSNFNELRGGMRRHEALDIMARRGTPILSATKGRVVKLFTSKAGGLMVYAADSAERFILMYAHLDGYARGLSDGAALDRGQVIGYVGFTGNALPTAPHLHFAIAKSEDVSKWWMGTPIDPLPLLRRSH